MIEAVCWVRGCGEHIKDALHVDEAVTKMQLHFRALHPNKYLNPAHFGETVQQFNQTLEEYFTMNFGGRWWQQRGINHPDALQYLRTLLVEPAEGQPPAYCTALLDEARAAIEAIEAANPGIINQGANQAGDVAAHAARFRPERAFPAVRQPRRRFPGRGRRF